MNGYRPEIDGLRAVAVLSVLLFHLGIPRFAGGYVGVDVFFVISGYLITRNILNPSFSFQRFYLARFRRLFPALLATVAFTVAFGTILLPPIHLEKLAASSIASLLTVSNIYFWTQAGYWDLESNLKPLLHIWSLSVEEQFYFIWPMLLVVAMRFRRGPMFVVAVCAVIGLLAAGQFSQTTAFYWAPLRAFEFAIGASVIWRERFKLSAPAAEIAAGTGFLMVAYAVFMFGPSTNFPYPAALLPCVGAAMMIYAGRPAIAHIWDNPVAVWTGRISYSLYLVHWPVIVFYSYSSGAALTGAEQAGLAVASIVLAIPLHTLVERRFRHPTSREWSFVSVTVALACLTLICAGRVITTKGSPWRVAPPPLTARELARITHPCESGAGLCHGPQKIVLIGDSHAIHIKIALAEALKRAGLAGTAYPSVTSCFFLRSAFPVYFLSEIATNPCPAAEQDWHQRIEADNPDIVILAGFWIAGIDPSVSGLMVTKETTSLPSFSESRTLFERQMTETVRWLTSTGRKVVIIGTSPMVDSPPSICYDRPEFIKRDCTSIISKPETHAATTGFLKSFSGPSVLYVDLMAALCKGATCPLGEGGKSFYYDRHHLSARGELWLADHAFGPTVDFLRASKSVVSSSEIPSQAPVP